MPEPGSARNQKARHDVSLAFSSGQLLFQNVSGRIRVALKVTCPHVLLTESHHPGKTHSVMNGQRLANQDLTNEEIYGGIVALVVGGRHNIYKDLMDVDESTVRRYVSHIP